MKSLNATIEIEKKILAGEIVDSKSICGIQLFKLYKKSS